MAFADILARVNACLNATSGVCLVLGFRAIRRGDPERHKRFMLAACSASVLFLISYVTRVLLQGLHQLNARGTLHTIYVVVLSTHMFLAAIVLPLAAFTVYLSLSGQLARHRRVARITLPLWLYVSATGVLVYLMLYHYPGHL